MGLDAQVIAIGPYSGEIATSLEYGEQFYADVAPGSTVVTNVFIAGTSDASHKLAEAFGVGALELGKHQLDPSRANIAALSEVFGEQNAQQFQRLARAGFTFFYLPNA
ncbi:MAG TPA: hypothetical protein VK195_14205 [Burkholderiaceae bacterium]|nr:hypothetical protein [Burkholderiaceae bacterium]